IALPDEPADPAPKANGDASIELQPVSAGTPAPPPPTAAPLFSINAPAAEPVQRFSPAPGPAPQTSRPDVMPIQAEPAPASTVMPNPLANEPELPHPAFAAKFTPVPVAQPLP